MRLTSRMTLVLALASSASAIAAVPTDRSEFVQFLVPVSVPAGVTGAFGSHWRTELFLLNGAAEPVTVSQGYLDCNLPTCGSDPYSYPSGTYQEFTELFFDASTTNPGALLYVERTLADQIELDLRLYEESVAFQSAGIVLPLVPGTGSRSRIDVLNVPVGPRHRAHLRVYELNGRSGHPVEISVFDPSGDLLERFVVLLRGSGESLNPVFPAYPGFAQVFEIGHVIGAFAESEVRISVTSAGEPLSLWAFVSVTDNVNQSVTIIGP